MSIIKNNDAPYVIGRIAESSLIGRTLAWNFVKEQWNVFRSRYGNNIFLLGRMIKSVLEKFSSMEVLKDVENFFKSKDVGSSGDAISQSMSEIVSKYTYKSTILNDEWFKGSL